MRHGDIAREYLNGQPLARRRTKLFLCIIGICVLSVPSLLLVANFVETRPGYVLEVMRKTLNDPSLIQGIEVINENQNSTGFDYEVHLEAKIPLEAAERMLQNVVFWRCSGPKHECGDPAWEVPSDELMYTRAYNEGVLCTMSWRADIEIDRTYEDTDILCINKMTGELWFSHYSY